MTIVRCVEQVRLVAWYRRALLYVSRIVVNAGLDPVLYHVVSLVQRPARNKHVRAELPET